MLLQTIVAELDAELDRLQTLRQIVNGLSSSALLDELLMELNQSKQGRLEADTSATLSESLTTSAAIRIAVPARIGRARRQAEPRALASHIPMLPVAIPAAQVASERQRRAPQRASPRQVQPGRRGKQQATLPSAEVLPRVEALLSPDALRNRWLADL